MVKTKKLKSTARFRAGFGKTVKERLRKVESKSKKKQKCPYCKKFAAKRLSKGIWYCKSCKRKFTSRNYYLENK
jgi:large subunit ribosomal protein L37Ae